MECDGQIFLLILTLKLRMVESYVAGLFVDTTRVTADDMSLVLTI